MFSERLTYLRKSAKLTQQQLADALGVSRSTIGMYENGQREPNFETLESIADLFNVRMDSLISKSNSNEDNSKDLINNVSEKKSIFINKIINLDEDTFDRYVQILDLIDKED